MSTAEKKNRPRRYALNASPGTDALRASPEDNASPAENSHAALEAAYQKLLIEHQQLKQAYDTILHTTPDPRKLPPAGIPNETFEVDGNTYRMAAANLHIKSVGKRTALEAMVDDTLYPALGGKTILQWLVANNSTAIKKIS
jgi:hypothetical protein